MTPIPWQLLILRGIYEWRLWYVLPLAFAWLAYSVFLLRSHHKWFFVWLLLFPLLIGPIDIAATYCGWHYRMGLRQRFATVSQTDKAYSIERMPTDIQQEYARHDYHPRLRDIKVKVLWNCLSLPLLYAIGLLFWQMHRRTSAMKSRHIHWGEHMPTASIYSMNPN